MKGSERLKGKGKMVLILVCAAVLVIAAPVIIKTVFGARPQPVPLKMEEYNIDGSHRERLFSKRPSEEKMPQREEETIPGDQQAPDEGEIQADQADQIEKNSYYRGIVAGLRKMSAGTDYVEWQVIGAADSKKAAKKIADRLDLELLSYSEGIAVYQTGIPVMELMVELAEAREEEIQVSPNYIYKIN